MKKPKTIEEIIKIFSKDNKDMIFNKKDGITCICILDNSKDYESKSKKLEEKIKELNLTPICIERNKDNLEEFIIQLPEFKPKYTKEQIKNSYFDSFAFLINNVQDNSEIKFKKDKIILNKEIFIKQAILIFYRSNTNQYKETLDQYLNDIEYRKIISNLFDLFIANFDLK